jgi:hypothetical protein
MTGLSAELKDSLFLLVGFGCEYALAPLARYLTLRGLDYVACDMQEAPLPRLPPRPLIVVSSQHPSTSSAMFRALWGQGAPFTNYVSPDELFARHAARCRVFIPHDLESPVRSDELPYMSLFDLYCDPYPVNPALTLECESIFTGWIKHNAMDRVEHELYALVAERGVFFVNHIVKVLLEGGADYLYSRYASILEKGVPVKLPIWPGCADLAQALSARGANLVDATLPSTPLIAAARTVYVNAPGSVVAEAHYMGTPVTRLNLHLKEQVQPGQSHVSVVPYFDFEGMLFAITRHCERISG